MTFRTPPGVALLLALAAAAPARAQEPAGPPPPAQSGGSAGTHVQELLPEIGRIGAEVGIFAGAGWNPYELGRGLTAGGFINLPLFRKGSGKLSYEILVALGRSVSDPFTVTDAVAYVANLAAGASPQAALAGPPRAPFPVLRQVRSRARLLTVSPFGLRYTVTRFDRQRVRPYATAGLDFTVVITREEPLRDESLAFTGTAPFDAPLLGGQVAQAPELTALGRPTGQGNIELGGHAGAGFELRLSRGLSLNVDYRFTALGSDHHLHAATSALGVHW
jgi:hypothetical protein